ncbi:MAG: potassium channel family protein [Saprospiraceae bacterium]
MLGFKLPKNHPRFERTYQYFRRIRIAFYLLFGIITVGIIGFMFIAGYSLMDAFYMTVITLSTVGYGETRVLDFNGRLFTSFLIIFNLGIFAYAISSITSFLIEGDFKLLLKDYRVYEEIKKLENHVIICGLGRHGHEVMTELNRQGVPFVIIEKGHEKIEELQKEGDFLYIEGDGTNDDILEDAGIDKASALISTLGEDADNVFIVLSARQLNPDLRIISRAFNKKSEAKLYRAGADYVVLPERVGGFYMATMVEKPDVIEFMSLVSKMGSGQVMFEEFETSELKDEYQGKTIREMGIRGETGSNIIALHSKEGNYIINPGPDTFVRNDMRLVVLGNRFQMEKFRKVMLKKG